MATEFIIKNRPYDLSSHAGLGFVGKYLKRININALVDPGFSVRLGVANSAIVKSYLPCCVWAKVTSMPSRGFATTPSSNVPWV